MMWLRQALGVSAIGGVTVDDGRNLGLKRSTGFSAADTLGHRAVDAGARASF
jgi:hypothetical protein